MSFPGMRVAVVHDWLTGMRGGEKVLEAILELFPEAEIFTLFHFPGTVSSVIESRTIHVSPLQRFAAGARDYRRLLPLYPWAISRWKLEEFDLVFSSSHCVAKAAPAGSVPHISYCHTPMRYIWDRFDDYFPPARPAVRLVAATIAPALRRWDVESSAAVDRFIANSTFVRERIRTCYGKTADIVHPFVDEEFLTAPLAAQRGDYHLVVSALVPYKKIELAIEAAVRGGLRLVVVGGGPLLERLSRTGGEDVRFTGRVDQPELLEWIRHARSLVIPGVEDFGITALEAMACGTPVVALGRGGVLDSVIDGETGLLFDREDPILLAQTMGEAESRPWNREALRERARAFSRERFLGELATVVKETLQQP